MRVGKLDERDFLRPAPSLELLFAGNGFVNVVERFPVKEPFDLALVRESFDAMKLMLEDPLVEIACDPNVKGARDAAHDVDTIRPALAVHVEVGVLRLRMAFTS